jgi:site-specific recombinase XerD
MREGNFLWKIGEQGLRQLQRGAAGGSEEAEVADFDKAFGKHMLEKTLEELLGHKDVSTAMIYTHVLKQGGGYRSAVRSPPD